MTEQDYVTAASESDAVVPAVAVMPGVHAGAIIFVGIVIANIGNYAFHLIAARTLGPSSYGDVASLVALSGLIALPLGGLQIVVARTIAMDVAAGRVTRINAFTRRTIAFATVFGAIVGAALIAISPILARELHIDSVPAVVLTAALALPSVLTPALWGLAQGLQRFWTLAMSMSLPPVLRIVAVAILLAVGLGVPGAMAATLAASLLGVALPAWALRGWLRRVTAPADQGHDRLVMRDLGAVVLGLLAITSLTTIDVVVAKSVFSDHAAGIYASASLAGRLILYLPAAIVTVLLPKVSSRTALGRDARAILAGSVAATIAFCVVAIALYVLASSLLAQVAFGSGFEDVAGLLPLFSLAMSGFAILNVLLAYHLGRGSSTMSVLLAAGALVQVALFAVFHDSAHELLIVSTCVAAALIAAHEVFIEPALSGGGRLLYARLRARGAS